MEGKESGAEHDFVIEQSHDNTVSIRAGVDLTAHRLPNGSASRAKAPQQSLPSEVFRPGSANLTCHMRDAAGTKVKLGMQLCFLIT